MGVTMFLQQKLNPQPPDPIQAKMFMVLPFVFTFMLAQFAAGLVIYWSWNNLLSIAQQWVIMRRAAGRLDRWQKPPRVVPSADAAPDADGARGRAACCSRMPAGSSPAAGPTPTRCRPTACRKWPSSAAPMSASRACQRAHRPQGPGARLAHARAHAADQFLRSRRAADAGRPAGLRLRRGARRTRRDDWADSIALLSRPREPA